MTEEKNVYYKLGQIEGKIDAISILIASHIKQDQGDKTEIRQDIKSLEKTRTWVMGVAAAVSIGITSFSQFIWRTLGIS